jgi:hypothetical protein
LWEIVADKVEKGTRREGKEEEGEGRSASLHYNQGISLCLSLSLDYSIK